MGERMGSASLDQNSYVRRDHLIASYLERAFAKVWRD
jgi:hypothetical protein